MYPQRFSSRFVFVLSIVLLASAVYAQAPAGTWSRGTWLPPLAHSPGFGQKLDSALADLYAWCVSEDVPVDQEDKVREAVRSCPEQAISISEDPA